MRRESVPQHDDIQYRDYLVRVLSRLKEGGGSEFPPTPPLSPEQAFQQALQYLKKIFKQDFSTTDNQVIGANKVATEVLEIVLVEDLEFSVGVLPIRGSLADSEHLKNLIALSGQTVVALSTTYRIDLSRSDLQKTTRVRENILTLQSYLRDSKLPDFSDYNPFFLYKEEWRLRFHTPFFPENHYSLKRGLFAASADRERAIALIAAIKGNEDYKSGSSAEKFIKRIEILLNLDTNLIEGHRQFAAEEYSLAEDHYKKALKNISQLKNQMTMKVFGILPPDENIFSIVEKVLVPNTSDAKQFRNSLDPANHPALSFRNRFGQRPQGFGLGDWENNYKDGLSKGWWDPIDIPGKKIPPHFPYTPILFDRLSWRYDNRANLNVNSPKTLKQLEALNTVAVKPVETSDLYQKLEKDLFTLHDDMVSLIPHVLFLMLPVCYGDLSTAKGDYVAAANYYSQIAPEQLLRASIGTASSVPPSEADGDLPWSWADINTTASLNGRDYPYFNKNCERPFLLLRLGYLYLNWADQLYRVDQEAEVYRARELYKAVLQQYGIKPLPGAGLEPLATKLAKSSYGAGEGPAHIPRGGIGSSADGIDTSPRADASSATTRTRPGVPTPRPYSPETPSLGSRSPSSESPFGRESDQMDTFDESVHMFSSQLAEEAEVPDMYSEAEATWHALNEHVEASSALIDEEISEMPVAIKDVWGPLIAAKISPSELISLDVDVASHTLSGKLPVVGFFMMINPAILAQQTRASIGITQIDAGLNFYGYSHNLVPLLRYRPLATAANHFTVLAKQAETGFLSYKDHAEKAEMGLIQMRSGVIAAALRVQIEGQRILQAQDYVKQAEIQLQQVKDAIAAKKAEIADGNSICSQIGDYVSGMKDFLTGAPDKATSYIKSDYSAAFGFSKLSAGTTAGLGVVGGMVLFYVGSAVTLKGMADSANSRLDELQKLQKQQLPMALAGLDARKRELAIAQLQKGVATLEVLTAQEILRYSLLKTLNVETWTQMGIAMKSILRRYIDLGAMTGWLAERALSYAQDKDIRLIQFDYFQPKRHGLLAADTLQSDLAALEKEYIAGFQQTIPIKWTVSLAHDFPLQFGQLKAKGRCVFMTRDADLNLAYPGSFSHRIRAIDVAAVVPGTVPPPRGLLTNPGISSVEKAEVGKSSVLVRPPDVFPLSEFSLKNDMAVYSLPGEALMPFEGSGMDTLWVLELPAAANSDGLKTLADICITFNLQVRFSADRKAELAKMGETRGTLTLTRSALFSAKQLFPESLKAFVDGNDGDKLVFDVTDNLLPAVEKNRKITNVGIFFLDDDLPEIAGRLASEDVSAGVKFTTVKGMAHSNHVPEPASISTSVAIPSAELDALATGNPVQNWALTILAADNPSGIDREKISDVILGIEYTTQPVFG